MPTYDYVCRACDHEFEVFQSMTEAAKRTCPRCGKRALERKIGTGAAILFKGSGFYQTDYRSESYKKAAEAESKPASETKAETKAETKPEAKPETKAGSASDAKAGSRPEPKPAGETKPRAARVGKSSAGSSKAARRSKR